MSTTDKRGKTVLLTGATGFLGGYVIKELEKRDFRIVAVGRNEQKGHTLESEKCRFYPVDFTDKRKLEEVFRKEKIDLILHTGALSSAWGKWEDFYKINVIGTKNVAELALKYKAERMVYISSPSIYSRRGDRLGIREEDVDESNRLNHYIRSKIASEKVLRSAHEDGLYTVVIRPRGLIGVGDPSLIPRVMKANDRIGIPLFNKGKNLVDLTCVENVAYACYLCLVTKGIDGQVFNITNGEPGEFRKLLEDFCAASGDQARFLNLPFTLLYGVSSVLEWVYGTFGLKGEPILTRYTLCTVAFSQTLNIEKAERMLHYQPQKTLAEGINDYGKWWNENKKG
ncbi:MAG: NAD-dependent epimerase/dehydratase family protein [Eubacteriales bacterium]